MEFGVKGYDCINLPSQALTLECFSSNYLTITAFKS